MRFKLLDTAQHTKIIGFCAIVLTALACIFFTIKSPRLNQDLPKDNFVTLNLRKVASPLVSDTGNQIPFEEIEMGLMQASGLAFRTINGRTYILTAEHFCVEDNQELDAIASVIIGARVTSKLTVVDFEGDSWDSEVLYTDRDLDICLVGSSMPQVEEISLALIPPEIGDQLYVISAPKGISSPGVALHFNGEFSGCNSGNFCFYTMTSTFGSSGSVILNSDNEMVGMIQATPMEIENVSIGSGVHQLRYFLESASDSIGINLL